MNFTVLPSTEHGVKTRLGIVDSLLFDITLFSNVQGVISSRVVFAKKISKATSSSRISQLHHESIA